MIEISMKGVPLPCPSNRLYRAFMGKGMKFPRQILSAEARKKRTAVCVFMRARCGGAIQLTCAMSLHYIITPRDRRTPDIDAYEKSLLDCLQHSGVIVNDKQIVQITKEIMPIPHVPGWIDLTLVEVPA